jgi:5'-nucleotidase
MKNKPYIIISNDDGVDAPGINLLAKIDKKFGDVLVIGPKFQQSGKSHAVTVQEPLFANLYKEEDAVKYYVCSGTPVDCIKLGIKVFSERKPDLILAGINHGSNAGTNVFYSGTMAVAIEAVFEGVPSIGFSLLSHSHSADMSNLSTYIEHIIQVALDNPIPPDCCWNVNIPYQPENGIKGIKICPMSKGSWCDNYETRISPTNKPYYWIYGEYIDRYPKLESDQAALSEGYISIVPINIDITDYQELSNLKQLFTTD